MLLITSTGRSVIIFVAIITFLSYFENGRTFLKWLLWDFSGARFIYGKLNPEKDENIQKQGYKKPATLFLWLIGIYIATFGVASTRYKNNVDIIENRINCIYAQIPKDIYVAFQRIYDVQEMPCPTRPELLNPISVVKSFLPLKGVKYKYGVKQLKQLVEDWAKRTETIKIRLQREPDLGKRGWIKHIKGAVKDVQLNEDKRIGQLASIDLQKVHLEGTNLGNAHLEVSNLWDAHLEEADLGNAHLEGAKLRDTHLEGAYLEGAYLERANLWGAHLEGTYLKNADLNKEC